MSRVAIGLGSFLLFLVQPMMGRHILPWFGGGPSVWTACMLFFQLLLLGGYAYAHWLPLGRIHGILLATSLALLPLAPQAPASAHWPTLEVLRVLMTTIGLPYFLLSATSPLIQRWSTEASPYRLYALSNAGSLAGLLAYPFVIEPLFGLRTQAWMWSIAYAAFTVIMVWVSFAHPRTERPVWSRASGWWILLAASGSTLLLASTNQMCQEIAASPFLWVIPLALYLITFMIAFGQEHWYHREWFCIALAALVPLACIVRAAGLRAPLWTHITVDSAVVFAGAMICHGELAARKPHAAGLTGFYLSIAAGGALGGVLVAIVAPAVFNDFHEFPIALAATCLIPARFVSKRIGIAAVFAAAIAVLSIPGESTHRNFFGTLRVTESAGKRSMEHGRVTHGYQFLDAAKQDWPTAYYGPGSALGRAIDRHRPQGRLNIGVIGLGVGTAAAYGKEGDNIRFYEINPAVERLAREQFTFIKNSKAKVEVIIGDARISLSNQPPRNFDILAIDAFSSDSIPSHLLTVEAVDVYRRQLAPAGTLLFHITNQYLDLAPVVRGICQRDGWTVSISESPADETKGTSRAVWAEVLPGNPSAGKRVIWTDDRTSLFQVWQARN